MTPKKIKSVTLSRDKAVNYFHKAEQFFYVMKLCVVDREWDAVVLNGVHAAISMTDALLVQRAGIHSISQKHDDAIILLKQHYSREELNKNDVRFAKILTFKNLVSYQPDQMQEAKAKNFASEVERYFEWAKRKLQQAGL